MKKQNSIFKNTLILFISMFITKAVGAVLKIPLTNILGGIGMGYFSTAYSFFAPVLSLTAAALPTVITRMVAQNITLCRFRNARKIKKIAMYIGLVMGLAGTILLLLFAQPFSEYVANSPESCMAIIAIAPSVFFCCIAAVYRGYYEGLMNMLPTAVSQVVEAIFKAGLGLGAAYCVIEYGGNYIDKSAILPFAAAAAILGVTLSELAGLLYLVIKSRFSDDGITNDEICNCDNSETSREIAKQIIFQCIPIAIGAVCANLSSFIDLLTITNCINFSIVNDRAFFLENFSYNAANGTDIADLGNFVYGSYTGIVMSLFMLVPSMTSLVSKSALPDIAAAWEVKDNARLMRNVRILLKGTFSIGMPFCTLFAVLSEPMIMLLYSARPDEARISVLPLEILGYGGIGLALAGALFSVFQAINRSDLPIKLMLIGAVVKLCGNISLIQIPEINISGASIATVASFAVVSVAGLIVLKRLIRGNIGLKSIFFKPLISCVMCGFSAEIGYESLFNNFPLFIRLMLTIVLGGMIYFIFIALFERKEIKSLVKSRRKSAV